MMPGQVPIVVRVLGVILALAMMALFSSLFVLAVLWITVKCLFAAPMKVWNASAGKGRQ